MDEEQKEKLTQLSNLNVQFRKRMDQIFPRDEHGNLRESSRIITQAEVDETLKLLRQIEGILKELHAC